LLILYDFTPTVPKLFQLRFIFKYVLIKSQLSVFAYFFIEQKCPHHIPFLLPPLQTRKTAAVYPFMRHYNDD